MYSVCYISYTYNNFFQTLSMQTIEKRYGHANGCEKYSINLPCKQFLSLSLFALRIEIVDTYTVREKKGYLWIFDKKNCHFHKRASINRNKLKWNKACRHGSFNSSTIHVNPNHIIYVYIRKFPLNCATLYISHACEIHFTSISLFFILKV